MKINANWSFAESSWITPVADDSHGLQVTHDIRVQHCLRLSIATQDEVLRHRTSMYEDTIMDQMNKIDYW